MADQSWRASPPNSGRGLLPPRSTTNGHQYPANTNGGSKYSGVSAAATATPGWPAPPSSGNGGRSSPPLPAPQRSGQGVVPPRQGIPPSSPANSRTGMMGPPTSGRGGTPPLGQQSPFAGTGGAPGVVAGTPSYGQPGNEAAPPLSDPGRRYGAMAGNGASGGNGPPSGTRGYLPPPQTNGAFAKPRAGPPTAFPPSAPPVGGWTSESNGNGNGTAGQFGQHSARIGHAGSYPAPPPTFSQQQPPPPVAPPSGVGSNVVGLGPSQTYGGGMQTHGAAPGGGGGASGIAMGPPGAMSMYGQSRPPPSFPGTAPGQYQPQINQPYSNGGMPGSASTRPKIDPEQTLMTSDSGCPRVLKDAGRERSPLTVPKIPRPMVSQEVTTYRTCTPPSVDTPPAPSSNYVAVDEGNCSPRFMRSTMAQLPINPDAHQSCKLPMAVVVQPMACVGPDEQPVPLVDFGESGPLRCENCRAYINSYATYGRNGERWVCNFCKHDGAVPQPYQCPLDAMGMRRDRLQRSELCRGSVDFIVPKGVYCLRPEQQPIFVFCVDVSPRALETGFSQACFQAVGAALDVVPGGELARVGLITFDASLQVYRFDEEGAVSQIVVAADTEDPYAPLPPKDWILPIDSCRRGLPAVMEAIPGLLNAEGRTTTGKSPCASGAVLRAVADCLETIGGRVFLMTQSPPNTGAGGINAAREDSSLYGGDKEFRLYQPATATGGGSKAENAAAWATAEFYRLLAKDCAARQVCVDLMLWSGQGRNREFYDVATLGAVARVTGGRVTYLRDEEAGGVETALNLRDQLEASLRDHEHAASETVLKVRCTAGFSCTQRLGPGVENMPGELELAVVTPHHSIVCRLEHDGRKLEEGRLVFVQAALLYTSSSGQRRVRCHTLALPVTGALPSIFRSTDVETVSAVLARQGVSRALNNTLPLQTLHPQMEDQMLAMLYCYRKRCAPDSPSGQLILPETLRVLPLYTLCAHKMLALRPNAQGNPPDIRADERATRLLAAHNLSIVEMIKVLYPTLYSIHDLPPDVGDEPPPSPSRANAEQPNGYVDPQTGEERAYRAGEVPRPGVDVPVGLPPTSEKLSSQGVFLLDSGEDLLMYVGRGTSAEVLQELFGVATLPDGVGSGLRLVEQEGYEQARRTRNVIAHLRRGCSAHKPLSIIVANSGVTEEGRFVSLLVEDKTKQGTSYVDQLCQLHHKIQAKMP